jgi:hypothetical protein
MSPFLQRITVISVFLLFPLHAWPKQPSEAQESRKNQSQPLAGAQPVEIDSTAEGLPSDSESESLGAQEEGVPLDDELPPGDLGEGVPLEDENPLPEDPQSPGEKPLSDDQME